MARAHGGVGHPEEVLTDALATNVLRDIDTVGEEAIGEVGRLLTIGLPYDFPIEEELMTNEEVHQSLALRLEVGAYGVRAG